MKTIKTKKALLSVVLVAIAMSGIQKEAAAVADGNGTCSASEAADFDCANLGGNNIEFLGAFPSNNCPMNQAPLTTRCTVYFYKYNGTATNQVDVALPINLTKSLNEAPEINCSQYYTNGAGDPTTGFGVNLLTLGICRIANNISNLPSDINPPTTANFYISADPSTIDKTRPLNWQLKQGRSVFAGSIVGPATTEPAVLESEVTLRTPQGATVSYSNSGGNITLTGNTGRIVPISGTKLCIVKPGGDPAVGYRDPLFADNWTCETITYATEQCDIKTSGTDPCRWIGGYCIQY